MESPIAHETSILEAGIDFSSIVQYMCPLSLFKCITQKLSYRRNWFLRGIHSMGESIPAEESIPRNRLPVAMYSSKLPPQMFC